MSMLVREIPIEELTISKDRQRKEMDPEETVKLAGSIVSVGLIHPIVVRTDEDGNKILVAGERRLKALQYIWNFGEEVRCGDHIYPSEVVPCIDQGEMTEVEAYEMELEENIKRLDLSLQDRARSVSQLYELRRLQAEKAGLEAPSVGDLAVELRPEEAYESAQHATRNELMIARNLDNPDVAKAKTVNEAIKAIKRKEESDRHKALGITVGLTFTKEAHTLLKGDCLQLMAGMAEGTFDIILTDPPYGIDADEFGDSGGKVDDKHFYDDSLENWMRLVKGFAPEIFRLAKPQAHAYVFCDVVNFPHLSLMMAVSGWKVFRTPLIWVNPGAFRAPWPTMGPQRKYQCILYAIKGDKNVTKLYGDVLTYASDENFGHPAQKPVALLADLLRRSSKPGDAVLDPFAGSGSTFCAAHSVKVKATGIEMDTAAYGLAAKRLGELK